MTRQEMFNKSVAGLAKQGFTRAVQNCRTICAYKDVDGRRCAFGHLIPEGHPAEDYSGSYTQLIKVYPDLEVPGEENFICDLQKAHDANHHPEEMRQALRFVAGRYELTLPQELQ